MHMKQEASHECKPPQMLVLHSMKQVGQGHSKIKKLKKWIPVVVQVTFHRIWPFDLCIIPEQSREFNQNPLILPEAMMPTEPVAAHVLLSNEFYHHIGHGSMIVA